MRRSRAGVGATAHNDRGSATVVVLGVVLCLLLVTGWMAALATAGASRSAAQAAADLAAIAAATADRDGTGAACGVAAETAKRNGATLTECSDEGGGRYAISVKRVHSGIPSAVARARAGPSCVRDAC